MANYLYSGEFERWMASAKSTLKSAMTDRSAGFYNWACFKSQQSAEFASKAFLNGIGTYSFGHSVSLLLKKADFDIELINRAKTVDKYYILTIKTDAWAEGPPEDYYTLDNANEAIECSESIISGVEDRWKSLKKE